LGTGQLITSLSYDTDENLLCAQHIIIARFPQGGRQTAKQQNSRQAAVLYFL
jgi:hypothetical protein